MMTYRLFSARHLYVNSILNLSQVVLPTLQSSVVKISWFSFIIEYTIFLTETFSCKILFSFNFNSAQILSVTDGSPALVFTTLRTGLDLLSEIIDPWAINWLGEKTWNVLKWWNQVTKKTLTTTKIEIGNFHKWRHGLQRARTYDFWMTP